MTGEYDAWAAARAPELLAFAAALVADEAVAEAAVARVLARIRTRWSSVADDDPDVEARRLVVRSCSTPRRAAAVLRQLEDRSDQEIAEVLRCSESAARRHVARGLASVAGGPRATVAMASAPTRLLTREPPLPPTTTPAAGRSPGRTTTWVMLAVLLLVGGVAYVAHATRGPDGVIRYPRVAAPASWRYESYAGVQLQVPSTWGWGGSPVRSAVFPGPRNLGSCGSNQALVLSPADRSSYVSSVTAFVGHPSVTDQRCVPWGSAGSVPVRDAVWFASPYAVGVRSLGGTVAETRAVGGQHVTVFSPDPALRRQILGTAEQVAVDGNGCPARAVLRPSRGPAESRPESLSVCIYSQDTGASVLLYSGVLSAGAARSYVGQVGRAATATARRCPVPSGRWVAIGVHAHDATRWDVVDLRCGRIETAGSGSAPLTVATVRSWAVAGATAYLAPPLRADHGLTAYFRAPLG